VGKRFGRLKVLKVSDNPRDPRDVVVRCDCGKEKTVQATALWGGHTKSCGCKKRSNGQARTIFLEGQRFGRLVVLKRSQRMPNRYICKCDCGRTVEVLPVGLQRRKSCGCLRRLISKLTNLRKAAWAEIKQLKAPEEPQPQRRRIKHVVHE
jgi:hypothetical protein